MASSGGRTANYGGAMLTPEQVERANQMRWYHAIDFGSHQTCGRFDPAQPPNMTLFGVMDLLAGLDLGSQRCLDVGPAHGLISLGMGLAGAASVSAINVGGPNKAPQITFAEEVFDLDIAYHGGVALEQVGSVFEPGSLDVIVCAGVMYHLLNPADVFFRLRPLLRHGGMLVIETVAVVDDEPARFILNSERDDYPQPSTYFLPNPAMLAGLAKLSSFETLATRVNSPRRYSMLCQAVEPNEVSERTPLTVAMHDLGFEDPLFDLDALAAPALAPLEFTGTRGHQKINVREFTPDFAPHPKDVTNPIGISFK